MAVKVGRVHHSVMADVRVRNLSENVRKTLRRIALERDVSLNTLLIEILTKAANTLSK